MNTHFNRYIAYFLLITLFACKEEVTTVQARYQKLTEAVYASGNIMPAHDHQLFSEAAGFVVERLVDEGDEVKKGQVLFVIRNTQQRSKTQAAKISYDIAQLNAGKQSPVIEELKITLKNTNTKLQNDSINYFRQKKLLSKQATSKIQFEQAELAYRATKNEVERIESQLVQTKNRLLVDMKNAESNYSVQLDEQANYQIVSDMDGVIFQVLKEKGELIKRNEPIALIGKKGETYIQLNVDELDINKIQLGQTILLTIDIYPDRVVKAKVSKIYPMMDQRDQSFRVDAVFSEAFEVTYAGLNVEANIVIREKEKALVIPKLVLSGRDSLWVVNPDGEPKRIGIVKGTETMEVVEVLSGLDTSIKIIVNPEEIAL